MAHNIMRTIIKGEAFDHFVWAKDVDKTPWHGLGIKHHSLMTPGEALDLAKGENPVLALPVTYMHPNGTRTTAETVKLLVGMDPNGELHEFGPAGPDYTLVQNRTVAEIMEIALGDMPRRIMTCGILGKGQRVFFSSKIGRAKVKDPTGSGFEEVIDHYLVMENGNDGKFSWASRITSIMPVCQNTVTLGEALAKVNIRLVHKGNVEERARIVAQAFAETGALVSSVEEAICLLLEFTKVNLDTVVAYAKILFPCVDEKNVPQKVQNNRDLLMACYQTAPGCVDTPASGLRLYQAATFMNDRVLRKGDWAKTEWSPASRDFRKTAHQAVTALAASQN